MQPISPQRSPQQYLEVSLNRHLCGRTPSRLPNADLIETGRKRKLQQSQLPGDGKDDEDDEEETLYSHRGFSLASTLHPKESGQKSHSLSASQQGSSQEETLHAITGPKSLHLSPVHRNTAASPAPKDMSSSEEYLGTPIIERRSNQQLKPPDENVFPESTCNPSSLSMPSEQRSILRTSKVAANARNGQGLKERLSVSFAREKKIVTFQADDNRSIHSNSTDSSKGQPRALLLTDNVTHVMMSPVSDQNQSSLGNSSETSGQSPSLAGMSGPVANFQTTLNVGSAETSVQNQRPLFEVMRDSLSQSLSPFEDEGVSPIGSTESPGWAFPSIEDIARLTADNAVHCLNRPRTSLISMINSPLPEYNFGPTSWLIDKSPTLSPSYMTKPSPELHSEDPLAAPSTKPTLEHQADQTEEVFTPTFSDTGNGLPNQTLLPVQSPLANGSAFGRSPFSELASTPPKVQPHQTGQDTSSGMSYESPFSAKPNPSMSSTTAAKTSSHPVPVHLSHERSSSEMPQGTPSSTFMTAEATALLHQASSRLVDMSSALVALSEKTPPPNFSLHLTPSVSKSSPLTPEYLAKGTSGLRRIDPEHYPKDSLIFNGAPSSPLPSSCNRTESNPFVPVSSSSCRPHLLGDNVFAPMDTSDTSNNGDFESAKYQQGPFSQTRSPSDPVQSATINGVVHTLASHEGYSPDKRNSTAVLASKHSIYSHIVHDSSSFSPSQVDPSFSSDDNRDLRPLINSSRPEFSDSIASSSSGESVGSTDYIDTMDIDQSNGTSPENATTTVAPSSEDIQFTPSRSEEAGSSRRGGKRRRPVQTRNSCSKTAKVIHVVTSPRRVSEPLARVKLENSQSSIEKNGSPLLQSRPRTRSSTKSGGGSEKEPQSITQRRKTKSLVALPQAASRPSREASEGLDDVLENANEKPKSSRNRANSNAVEVEELDTNQRQSGPRKSTSGRHRSSVRIKTEEDSGPPTQNNDQPSCPPLASQKGPKSGRKSRVSTSIRVGSPKKTQPLAVPNDRSSEPVGKSFNPKSPPNRIDHGEGTPKTGSRYNVRSSASRTPPISVTNNPVSSPGSIKRNKSKSPLSLERHAATPLLSPPQKKERGTKSLKPTSVGLHPKRTDTLSSYRRRSCAASLGLAPPPLAANAVAEHAGITRRARQTSASRTTRSTIEPSNEPKLIRQKRTSSTKHEACPSSARQSASDGAADPSKTLISADARSRAMPSPADIPKKTRASRSDSSEKTIDIHTRMSAIRSSFEPQSPQYDTPMTPSVSSALPPISLNCMDTPCTEVDEDKAYESSGPRRRASDQMDLSPSELEREPLFFGFDKDIVVREQVNCKLRYDSAGFPSLDPRFSTSSVSESASQIHGMSGVHQVSPDRVPRPYSVHEKVKSPTSGSQPESQPSQIEGPIGEPSRFSLLQMNRAQRISASRTSSIGIDNGPLTFSKSTRAIARLSLSHSEASAVPRASQISSIQMPENDILSSRVEPSNLTSGSRMTTDLMAFYEKYGLSFNVETWQNTEANRMSTLSRFSQSKSGSLPPTEPETTSEGDRVEVSDHESEHNDKENLSRVSHLVKQSTLGQSSVLPSGRQSVMAVSAATKHSKGRRTLPASSQIDQHDLDVDLQKHSLEVKTYVDSIGVEWNQLMALLNLTVFEDSDDINALAETPGSPSARTPFRQMFDALENIIQQRKPCLLEKLVHLILDAAQDVRSVKPIFEEHRTSLNKLRSWLESCSQRPSQDDQLDTHVRDVLVNPLEELVIFQAWKQQYEMIQLRWTEMRHQLSTFMERFPKTRFSKLVALWLDHLEDPGCSQESQNRILNVFNHLRDGLAQLCEYKGVVALGEWKLNVSLPVKASLLRTLQDVNQTVSTALEQGEKLHSQLQIETRNLSSLQQGNLQLTTAKHQLMEQLQNSLLYQREECDHLEDQLRTRRQTVEQLKLVVENVSPNLLYERAFTQVKNEAGQLKDRIRQSVLALRKKQAIIQYLTSQRDFAEAQQRRYGIALNKVDLDGFQVELNSFQLAAAHFKCAAGPSALQQITDLWSSYIKSSTRYFKVDKELRLVDFNYYDWHKHRLDFSQRLREAEGQLQQRLWKTYSCSRHIVPSLAIPPDIRYSLHWRYEGTNGLLEGLKLQIDADFSNDFEDYVPQRLLSLALPSGQFAHFAHASLIPELPSIASALAQAVDAGHTQRARSYERSCLSASWINWDIRRLLYSFAQRSLNVGIDKSLQELHLPRPSALEKYLRTQGQASTTISASLIVPPIPMVSILHWASLCYKFCDQVELLMHELRHLTQMYPPESASGARVRYQSSNMPYRRYLSSLKEPDYCYTGQTAPLLQHENDMILIEVTCSAPSLSHSTCLSRPLQYVIILTCDVGKSLTQGSLLKGVSEPWSGVFATRPPFELLTVSERAGQQQFFADANKLLSLALSESKHDQLDAFVADVQRMIENAFST